MCSRNWIGALAFCLFGLLSVSAATPAQELQQALGAGQPLYSASPAELAAAVKLCASRDPGRAGACLALTLRSGRNDADAIAPPLVQAAIQGLGANPKPDLIGSIVGAAVSATPSEVLDIVTAAVKVSPRSTAAAIVAAAVRAVPHPEKLVTINVQSRARLTAAAENQNDYKQSDYKQSDYKQTTPGQKQQLTLAEAIVQAALNGDPTLSEDSLTTAADIAITASFATIRPPILTGILAPVAPVIPSNPASAGGATTTSITFSGPGPVSP